MPLEVKIAPLNDEIIRNTIRRTWEYHESDWMEMLNEMGEELTLSDIRECVFDTERFVKFCTTDQAAAFKLLSYEEIIEEIGNMYPEVSL